MNEIEHKTTDSEQSAEDFYDTIARKYDRLRFSSRYLRTVAENEQSFVWDHIKVGSSVLEIGPGAGRFTAGIAEKAEKVTAIDISENMLEQLRTNVPSSKLSTIKKSVYELQSLSDFGSFDTVVCMRVLPHLDDPAGALKLMAFAVKQGGNVIIDFWNLRSFGGLKRSLSQVFLGRHANVLTNFHTHSRALEMVEQSGLSVTDTVTWGYPRIGAFSLDRFGNRFMQPLGYALIFNAVSLRNEKE